MGWRDDDYEARQKRRENEIIDQCRHIRTSAELDQMLDGDEAMKTNPELRTAVRQQIQALVPHLRDV